MHTSQAFKLAKKVYETKVWLHTYKDQTYKHKGKALQLCSSIKKAMSLSPCPKAQGVRYIERITPHARVHEYYTEPVVRRL